jgi:hypothetical protein
MAKKPSKPPLSQRAAHDPKLLAKARANPGLRSKLSTSQLTSSQQRARALSARLNAPVTPGSSLTNRDVAHQAQTATAVKYAPQEQAIGQELQQAQGQARDFGGPGGFYDQYLAQLREHSANVAAQQGQQQQALQGLAGAVTGLAGQGAQAQAQDASADAATRGMQAGDQTGLQSNAAAIRQQLLASLGSASNSQAANASGYADTLSRVVGPTQKLSGQATGANKIRDVLTKRTGLKGEEGAFNQSVRDQIKSDEAKNALALQIAGGKAAADVTTATIKAQQNTPSAKGAVAGATASATQAAKYGYTAHQWALLGPTARNKIITTAKKTSSGGSDTVYTSGPFAGKKKSEIAGLSDSERQRIVSDFNKGKGKTGTGKGPDWHTPSETGAALTQLTGLKQAATSAQTGKPFVPGHAGQRPLSRHEAAQKILGYGPIASKLKDPILVSAALDAVYDGHLSRETIKKLIAAGYKPSRVAQTLGVPTAATYKPPPKPKGRTGAAALIPATPSGGR